MIKNIKELIQLKKVPHSGKGFQDGYRIQYFFNHV